MANGVYGTVVPSNISINDVDIFYSYSPTRNSNDVENTKFTKINSSLLTQVNTDSVYNDSDTILEGMYNLKLPLLLFNQKGYYYVYIKPKEIPVLISDVGVLSTYPDIKGIVLDTASVENEQLQTLMRTNNSLVGYRIIYINTNGSRADYYRIITSNNKCEPVVQNMTDTNSKSVRYRYNDSSSLTFLTVTPSTSTSFKPNAVPYIGTTAQKILLVNTKFEPILMELEMVDKDAETISTMLEGSQLRDLDNGLVTTFNESGEIYNQSEHYSLKNPETGNPVYEVKKNRLTSIDFSQNINDK